MNNFIELHERGSGKPIIIRINAIDCVRSDTIHSYPVTLLTVGSEKYDVVESYEQIFRILIGWE